MEKAGLNEGLVQHRHHASSLKRHSIPMRIQLIEFSFLLAQARSLEEFQSLSKTVFLNRLICASFRL